MAPLTPGLNASVESDPHTPGQPSLTSSTQPKGYKNKKVKPANKENVSQVWSFRDKALFRRGLVKYGPSFTEIAVMIGTKTYTIVKEYYKTLGGGKTQWIKPLLSAHSRLKKNGQLDEWSILLTDEEEAAAQEGRLRALNLP